MILDARAEYAYQTALSTGGSGTTVFGNVMDLTKVRDIGNGQDLFWYGVCTTAGAGGTSVSFQLVSADDAALSTNAVVHLQTPVIVTANILAGKMLFITALPREVSSSTYHQFIGVKQVIVGTFTAGKVSTGLTLDMKGWKGYPDAVN